MDWSPRPTDVCSSLNLSSRPRRQARGCLHRLVQKPAFEESRGAWARPGPYRPRGLQCRFGYDSRPWQWSPSSRTVERKPSKLIGHRGHFSSGVSSGAYGPVIRCPPSVTGARGAVPADGRRSQPGLEAHAPRRTGSLAACCPGRAMSRYQNAADEGSLWQRAHHVVTAQPQSSRPRGLCYSRSFLSSAVWSGSSAAVLPLSGLQGSRARKSIPDPVRL